MSLTIKIVTTPGNLAEVKELPQWAPLPFISPLQKSQ